MKVFILVPNHFSSADYPGKICDQQEILQQWLLTLPTTLLEDVVEKVKSRSK